MVLLGRLGMWLSFHALLWTAGTWLHAIAHQLLIVTMSSTSAAMLLAMPAALSRGWMSERTLEKVQETANDTAAIVQAFIDRHTRK